MGDRMATSRVRPTLRILALVAVGSLLAGMAMAQSESFHFDIGTQSMSAALREYARISGQQIIFTEDVVAGIEAAPLMGDFTAVGALSRLLAGTDLITEVSPSGAFMIRAAVGQK
jgi:hypothetical protein